MGRERPGVGGAEPAQIHRVVGADLAVQRHRRAGRDQRGIHRHPGVGLQAQVLRPRVAGGADAIEVEVGVVRHRQRRGRVGAGLEVDAQPPPRMQAVAHPHLDRAGKSLVAVGRMQREDRLVGCLLLDAPEPVAPAVRPAVELVGRAGRVRHQRPDVAIAAQHRAGDAVGPAPDGGAGVAGQTLRILGVRAAGEHLARAGLALDRHPARQPGRAPRAQRDLQAIGATQGQEGRLHRRTPLPSAAWLIQIVGGSPSGER